MLPTFLLQDSVAAIKDYDAHLLFFDVLSLAYHKKNCKITAVVLLVCFTLFAGNEIPRYP